MFEFQTAFVRDVFLGYIKLPDKEQWQSDIDKWRARENSLGSVDFFGVLAFQTDYIDDLYILLLINDNNQYLSKFDHKKVNKMVKDYCKNRLEDILRYRDVSYQLIIDTKNTKIIPVYKPWMENMDDSLEDFINNYREKNNII
ncbi:unnamed protein product [Adineta steineri]|uniref:Uncharacterized protein n=1 Tax=Adineta steineri TaxID=433720 RepID=A0A815QJ93_9BILA|nr:unnamed protein product [Adineta steineri]CAF4082490.1 unnamed protein product [Adineta steineri]